MTEAKGTHWPARNRITTDWNYNGMTDWNYGRLELWLNSIMTDWNYNRMQLW